MSRPALKTGDATSGSSSGEDGLIRILTPSEKDKTPTTSEIEAYDAFMDNFLEQLRKDKKNTKDWKKYIQQYRFERFLGSGSYGIVFEVSTPMSKNKLALKYQDFDYSQAQVELNTHYQITKMMETESYLVNFVKLYYHVDTPELNIFMNTIEANMNEPQMLATFTPYLDKHKELRRLRDIWNSNAEKVGPPPEYSMMGSLMGMRRALVTVMEKIDTTVFDYYLKPGRQIGKCVIQQMYYGILSLAMLFIRANDVNSGNIGLVKLKEDYVYDNMEGNIKFTVPATQPMVKFIDYAFYEKIPYNSNAVGHGEIIKSLGPVLTMMINGEEKTPLYKEASRIIHFILAVENNHRNAIDVMRDIVDDEVMKKYTPGTVKGWLLGPDHVYVQTLAAADVEVLINMCSTLPRAYVEDFAHSTHVRPYIEWARDDHHQQFFVVKAQIKAYWYDISSEERAYYRTVQRARDVVYGVKKEDNAALSGDHNDWAENDDDWKMKSMPKVERKDLCICI
jgi:hypothetical protein